MRRYFSYTLAVLLTSALAVTALAMPADAVTPNRTMQTQILKLVNQARVQHGCAPLRANARLYRAATSHTVLMGKRNRLSHQLRGEVALGKRITRTGYRWRLVGENVGFVTGSAAARTIVRAWLKSPGHRRNILNCKFRDSGISAIKMHGRYWFTQDFARHW